MTTDRYLLAEARAHGYQRQDGRARYIVLDDCGHHDIYNLDELLQHGMKPDGDRVIYSTDESGMK